MLTALLLPVVLTTVALFFTSFLSWMVFPFHRRDWRKMPNEDAVLAALRQSGVPRGNYMLPGADQPQDMRSDEFKRKYEAGSNGVLTIFGKVNMGANLGLTMLYFLVVCFCLAYLATLGLPRGAKFMTVFRFVSTAGLLTFLPAIVQHSIWFKNRIVGHVIESMLYAAIVGAIFAAMWPK